MFANMARTGEGRSGVTAGTVARPVSRSGPTVTAHKRALRQSASTWYVHTPITTCMSANAVAFYVRKASAGDDRGGNDAGDVAKCGAILRSRAALAAATMRRSATRVPRLCSTHCACDRRGRLGASRRQL